MKLGICQIKTTLKKIENINKAREMIIKTINQTSFGFEELAMMTQNCLKNVIQIDMT